EDTGAVMRAIRCTRTVPALVVATLIISASHATAARLAFKLSVPPNSFLSEQFGRLLAVAGRDLPRAPVPPSDPGEVFLFDGRTGQLAHTFISPTPFGEDGFGSSIAATDRLIAIAQPGPGAVHLFDVSGGFLRTLVPDPKFSDPQVAILGDQVIVGE